jgi:UDP-N-acetylglucosamine--N-acetylmuramyl-(pentapeptide) pyrophosphoryl-undecaprenol N-acetylglucosamine transferase
MNAKILVAVSGGGTGGHIFPALAIADEVKRLSPGAEVVYLGRKNSMEQELAERAHIPFIDLPAMGLTRGFSLKNVTAAWLAVNAYWKASQLLSRLGVQAVAGTGGFVCGPVILAAAAAKIPTLIHESNLTPGLTNRWLGRIATRITVAHETTRTFFPAGRTEVTGFPLRPDLLDCTRLKGCRTFGLDPKRPVLFVFPGSLAARKINRVMTEALPALCKKAPQLQFIWMTGRADLPLARRVVDQFPLPVIIREFVYEVAEAYAAADLVLARAGAGTLAELAALGKPAILVPYPHATGQHQLHNAQALAGSGAIEILPDDKVGAEVLLRQILETLDRLPEMTRRAKAVSRHISKTAARDLAQQLLHLAKGYREAKHKPSLPATGKSAPARRAKPERRT